MSNRLRKRSLSIAGSTRKEYSVARLQSVRAQQLCSVVFFDEFPETIQRGESKIGPASNAEPPAPGHNSVNLRWSSCAKAKNMQISSDASTATGTGWVRTESAVANGEVATWQLKLSAGTGALRAFLVLAHLSISFFSTHSRLENVCTDAVHASFSIV